MLAAVKAKPRRNAGVATETRPALTAAARVDKEESGRDEGRALQGPDQGTWQKSFFRHNQSLPIQELDRPVETFEPPLP